MLFRSEHIRPGTTVEDLAGLKAAFEVPGEQAGFDAVALQKYPEVEAINHVHTAGNSSGIVDGAAAVLLSLAVVALAGGGTVALATGAGAAALLTALLTYDYSGSTPVEGGSHFEERRWRVVLDRERCRGVFNCWEVCPEACFEKREDRRQVDLAHDERCVRCGACVVQCPMDALFLEDAEGRRVEQIGRAHV